MAYYNNTSSIPCKYFQQGKCNRGNSCKYAHVYANASTKQDSGNAMSEEELYRSFINTNSFSKIEKTVISDLKDSELFQTSPLCSAYSYGPPCTVNLIQGRDLSAEESRFKYYDNRQKGTLNQYEIEMAARGKDIQKCFSHIRSHPDWAARFLQKSTKELRETGQMSMQSGFINFPLDVTGQAGNTGVAPSAFGQNPFTKGPSTFGNTPGAIGQSAPQGKSQPFGFGSGFGSTGTASPGAGGVFGKPSFSTPANGSAFPPNASNAFGGATSSQPAATPGSIFGQPQFASGSGQSSGSAFGAPKFGSTSFGGNAFGGGQSGSAFGGNQGGSAFGGSLSSSQSGGQGNSAFGAPAFGAPAFGAPAFGSNATSTPATSVNTNSPFGSLKSGNTAASSLFGTATTSSPFGSLQNKGTSGPTASPFTSLQNSTTFGTTTSPFASLQNGKNATAPSTNKPPGQLTNPSPFGIGNTSTTFGPQQSTGPAFGKQFAANPTPNSTSALGVSPTVAATNGGAQRFVQGLPPKEETLEIEQLDKQTLEQFQAAQFTLGKVPDMPPPVALIS